MTRDEDKQGLTASNASPSSTRPSGYVVTEAEPSAAVSPEVAVERFSRQLAVLLVDTAHLYTAEFAPSPAAHIEEYDNLQSAIQFVLTGGNWDALDLAVLRAAVATGERQ